MDKMEHMPLWPDYDFCVVGDDVWFLHGMLNCLIKYNLKKRTAEVVGNIKGKRMVDEAFLCKVFYYDNEIIIIPRDEKYIAFYSIDEKNFDYMDNEEYKFREAFQDGNIIYAITENVAWIVKIDLNERKFVDKKKIIDDESKVKYTVCGVAYETTDCVLIPIYSQTDSNTDMLVEISKTDKSISVIKCNIGCEGFYTAVMYDDAVYALSDKKYDLYKIDAKTGKLIDKICQFDEDAQVLGVVGDKILLLKDTSHEYLSLDVKDNKVITLKKSEGEKKGLFAREQVRSIFKKYNNVNFVYDSFDGILYEIKGEVVAHCPMLDKAGEDKIIEQIKKEGLPEMFREGIGYDLSMFLDIME